MRTLIDSEDHYHNNRGVVELVIADGSEMITAFEDYTFYVHAKIDQHYLMVNLGRRGSEIYLEVSSQMAERLIRMNERDAISIMFEKAQDVQQLF